MVENVGIGAEGESFGDYLDRERESLLAEWERRASRLSAARDLDRTSLRDHLPLVLQRIADALRDTGGSLAEQLEDVPDRHALDRLEVGYKLPQTVHELAMLRDVVFERWAARSPPARSVGEVRRFSQAIDHVIARSVDRFASSRERTLRGLEQMASAALASESLDLVLPRLLAVLLESTAAVDTVALFLRDPAGSLRMRAVAGPGTERIRDLVLPPGAGLPGLAARERRPLVVRDAATDPRTYTDWVRESGLHAVLALPLLDQDNVVGVAIMGSRSAYELSGGDRQLLSALAARATAVIVRTRLVEGVRESEQRLRLLMEGIRDRAIYMLDPQGRVASWNLGAERIKGWSAAEIQGRPFSTFFTQEDRAQGVPEEVLRIAARDGRHATETARVRKDGSRFRADVIVTAVRDASGALRGFATLTEDVTARREAEHELRRIFEVSPDLICVTGLDGRFRRVNPAFSATLGWGPEELVGRAGLTLVHPDDVERTRATSEPLLRGEQVLNFENRLRARSGDYRWLAWNIAPDLERGLIHAVARDISPEKARSEFEQQLIGIVSHDLRNPLTAVLVTAGSLLRRGDELDEATLRGATRIQSAVQRALRLIRDLLDFTQARLGGGIPLERRPADLRDIVRQALDEAAAAYPEREFRHEEQGAGDGSWDPDRIAQALSNLLGNAVRYGAPGSAVTLRCHFTDDEALIEVHNDGPPIAADLLPRIFQPMRRGASGEAEGVGLGLYIVDRIVRAHGGQVDVRSAAGEGTTFVLRLPRARPPLAH